MTYTYDVLEAERYRARHAIQANPDKPVQWVLSTYMIRPEISGEFQDGTTEVEVVSKRTKRTNKYSELEKWLDQNVGGVFSPKDIARATAFSTSTIRKYIAKNVTRFSNTAPARWEVRDPKSERQEAKKLKGTK